MDPKDYRHSDSYKSIVVKLNTDKRVKIDKLLNHLYSVHENMLEEAVRAKEYKNFPEANEIINYIRKL